MHVLDAFLSDSIAFPIDYLQVLPQESKGVGFAFSLNVRMDEKMISAAPGNSLTSEGPPCAPPIPESRQLLWLQPPAHLEQVQQASPTAGGGWQQVYRGP